MVSRVRFAGGFLGEIEAWSRFAENKVEFWYFSLDI